MNLNDIALKVEDEISTAVPELMFCDTEAFVKLFARRLVEELAKQEPDAWKLSGYEDIFTSFEYSTGNNKLWKPLHNLQRFLEESK